MIRILASHVEIRDLTSTNLTFFPILLIICRLAWELEEIKHNFLDNYFESRAKERELFFIDFISWESIQAEIWYNKRGVTDRIIADIWENIAGCVTRGVDKDTFVRIYKTVCSGSN